ncbi:Arc family DNA-binding protein [Acinetobacter sp. SCLZS86]|uniref:Arc family DNA-binding protein n=1 Tax=Acinetobacter TaxID=469 RepID=UPI0015B7ABC2|nr:MULTISPECIES: Arc family DNA-binding protein [Acinetobacter]NWK52583.1 Arc family DNA-binding protein [Acinetobacter sp. SwsAc5]UIP26308.1 Arc family DNA-binding protein [Acinetobacter towneri]UIZ56926.1 Arc family DNA-binding protein [Acinetobacter sp. SCLZS86]
MNPNTHELAQLKIRIPANLRKQLQEESIAQQRSMNAQINFILKQFLQIPSNVQQMKDN